MLHTIFPVLALVATLSFLAGGDTATGGRTLKNYWETRGKAVESVHARIDKLRFAVAVITAADRT